MLVLGLVLLCKQFLMCAFFFSDLDDAIMLEQQLRLQEYAVARNPQGTNIEFVFGTCISYFIIFFFFFCNVLGIMFVKTR